MATAGDVARLIPEARAVGCDGARAEVDALEEGLRALKEAYDRDAVSIAAYIAASRALEGELDRQRAAVRRAEEALATYGAARAAAAGDRDTPADAGPAAPGAPRGAPGPAPGGDGGGDGDGAPTLPGGIEGPARGPGGAPDLAGALDALGAALRRLQPVIDALVASRPTDAPDRPGGRAEGLGGSSAGDPGDAGAAGWIEPRAGARRRRAEEAGGMTPGDAAGHAPPAAPFDRAVAGRPGADIPPPPAPEAGAAPHPRGPAPAREPLPAARGAGQDAAGAAEGLDRRLVALAARGLDAQEKLLGVGRQLNEDVGQLMRRQDFVMQQVNDLERRSRSRARTALKR